MEYLLKKQYEPADPSPAGTRFCTNCNLQRNSIGGYWKIIMNGKQRRWICKQCITNKFF